MATALPSMLSYPALPPPRATALRPISAGDAGARNSDKPQAEAEALREDELYRLRPEGAESHSASAGTSRSAMGVPQPVARSKPAPAGKPFTCRISAVTSAACSPVSSIEKSFGMFFWMPSTSSKCRLPDHSVRKDRPRVRVLPHRARCRRLKVPQI